MREFQCIMDITNTHISNFTCYQGLNFYIVYRPEVNEVTNTKVSNKLSFFVFQKAKQKI